MKESDERKPRAPQKHFIHILNIDHTEHKDEFVEDIVPELVLDALGLGDSELAEDETLDAEAEHGKRTVRDVDQGLEQYKFFGE